MPESAAATSGPLSHDRTGPGGRNGTRLVLIAALLPLCWLAMQVVHEAGHVLAAWGTGGVVRAVVLHPLAISRTDVEPNPRPVAVVWGGPAFGAVAPVLAWLVVAGLRVRIAYLWRFFAGFCLIANGVYIGSGVVEPVGDAADLVRLGAPVWSLSAFGLVAVAAGFALWHRQGASFGLGAEGRAVPAGHAWGTVVLLAGVVAAECVWSGVTGFR